MTAMKRSLVLLLVLGLVAGMMAGPVEAKKKKKKKVIKITREAQGTYLAPASAAGNCTQTDGVGCMTIASGATENYLTAKITDAHGQPVAVAIKADLNGDAQSETLYGTFCGETAEPIKIDPGAEIIFWIGITPDTAAMGCAPGEATQGTLDVTFSNLP
jgi:hypothetical protein